MIFEHEIPNGSHLYFGSSAKVKRSIEAAAAKLLSEEGYEEIVTPLFSHQQHESFADRRPLVRLNDEDNHEVSLRADSTADVVRIVTKRLGRSAASKKWFYIQPIFTFPTTEQYQVGAEVIDGDFVDVTRTALRLMDEIGLEPIVQIANIAIPKLLSEKYGIELEHIERMNVEKIVNSEHKWVASLVHINSVSDLSDLGIYPSDIADELAKIAKAVEGIDSDNIVISPLYFARLRYYDALMFRMFTGNTPLATGGTYTVDDINAAGFALYTDACIAQSIQKDNNE
jgi:histidyl-tRNA synthetase